jgi:dihydroorotase-like cyclic amidohydrolase
MNSRERRKEMARNIVYLPKYIIDTHCHGRDWLEFYKITIFQYLLEALNSYTRINVFQPNTNPPLITYDLLLAYISVVERARSRLGIAEKQYFYFGVTDYNLKECERALQHPLVLGLKIYPLSKTGKSVTTGKIGVIRDETIKKAYELARRYNKAVLNHCDYPEIIEPMGYVKAAEIYDLERRIGIAEQVPGVKIVICHPSCAESLQIILSAQRKGILVAWEKMPGYLWFTAQGHNWNPALNSVFYKCFNQLRTIEDRSALRDSVKLSRSNKLMWGASDSACHHYWDKLLLGSAGIPSHQEWLAVLCTIAQQNDMDDYSLARLTCFNQADYLNIPVTDEMIPYQLEKITDHNVYNNGQTVNPWDGSELLFPVPVN